MSWGIVADGAASLLDVFGRRDFGELVDVLKKTADRRAQDKGLTWEKAFDQTMTLRAWGQWGAFALSILSYTLVVYFVAKPPAPPTLVLYVVGLFPSILLGTSAIVARRYVKGLLR